jgi:3-phenylpropionate/trans-cinnamate dioxygenase ferredoxin subunit
MPETTSPADQVVIPLERLPPGSREVVTIGRREIAVFNVDGTIHAVSNLCPHQRAPMVAGAVGGTRLPSDVGEFKYGLQGQILRCPWHTYEFDLTTGRCLADPDRMKLAVYRVDRSDTEAIIHV